MAGQGRIARYTFYGKIASGGMATVHFGRLAGGAGFSRTVAIKRLHPHMAGEAEFVSTLVDEARLVARIHHPNVVPTLDVVVAEGEVLVVMEYVRGESLARLLMAARDAGRPIPLPIASAIVMGALSGLHAAHEAKNDQGVALGIVHRDVSPQNILVGADGVARIIDFGVAKAAGRLQTTRDGEIKGKVGYMSPEQLEEREVTRASDVYAMSVVLWEILANKRLFVAESEAAVFVRALAGAKEPPSRHAPSVSPELDALVMKGLAADPPARFASAKDMAEALVRIVPPALAMEVGAWVEEMASEGLAGRAAILADIESGASLPSTEDDDAPPNAGLEGRGDDVPTITTESASLSVNTRSPAGVPRPLRASWIGALAVMSVGAGIAAFVWRSPPSPAGVGSTLPSAQNASASAPPESARPRSAPTPSSPIELPSASATPTTSAAPSPVPARTSGPPPAPKATRASPKDTVDNSGF